MFGSKLKLNDDLIQRCRKHAEAAGYSSVEEFITHVLERELRRHQEQSTEDDEEVSRRLKGLGYIERDISSHWQLSSENAPFSPLRSE